MNKKELAKLLFQHKDIKSLFESRQFDASTLKKIISEEIMREAEDDWKSDNSEETQAMVAQIEELKGTLNEFKGRLEDVKGEFTQAKVDRNRPKMKEITDEKKMIVADIDRLENKIRRLEANLNIAYEAAGKSAPKDDDLQVAKIATAVKDAVSAADDSIVRSTDDPGSISKVAKDTSAKLDTAIRASDAVANKTVQADAGKEQGLAAFEELMGSARRSEFQSIYQKFLSRNLKSINSSPENKMKMTQSMKAFDDLDPIYRSSSYGANKEAADESLKSISLSILGITDPKQRNQLLKKFRGFIAKGSDKAIPSPEETMPQPPAGTGWKNAKSAARAKVTEDTTSEEIKNSLASADAFKAFWGVKGEVDAKMEQAKGLFDDGYFAKRIEELRNKATEDNKDKVAEEAANLAATVMGYSEFLNNMMAKQPDFQPPPVDFPQAIPTTEEEFNRSFVQPLVKIQEPTDASVDKDGLKEEQYVELFTTNAANNDVLKTITEKDLQVFGGWYIMSRQSKALNEETDPDAEPLNYLLERYGAFTDFWSDKKGPEFVSKDIKNSIKKRSKIRGLDPKLKATLAGIQTLIDSGQISIPDSVTIGEDPNKEAVGLVDKQMVQDVIQNTPEVEPDADADLSPLATEEMDAAWATTLDIFFGKSREYSSFMRQFLLKNQASMLYGMIDVLGQITTGGAGNEERAYTGEKTQVKQKEQPAASPAEAEKEANPPKTDTTTTDTSADDEETETTTAVLPESLEEQVINEIFGMFGGKDNEDKEIKFSPKSTSLMRQDLEAMVDLLRSLKTDIGQYKKYSTSSSVDPRFDGSTLKRAMDAKLKVVQQSIAHLTKVIDLEVQSQKDQLKADGAQAAQDSVDLQEASGSDRKVRIAEVEKVYNEMRRQYLKGLKVSLSKNQPNEAKAGAKAMKDYVMGEETFMSYFPSNIITSSGGVMTLGGAHKSMVDIIAPFIETIRDIVTITKTQKVSESNLQQAIGNLVMISNSIESMFKVPSLIDREFMQKYIEAAKQNPDNQPLTDEEPSQDDEQSRVKPLGDDVIDSLKSKLGDSFNWLGEKFLDIFATDIEQTEVPEDVQEEIIEDIKEIAGWYPNLSNDQQVAVGMFGNNLIRIRGINEVSIPTLKKLGTEIQTDKKKVLQAFTDLEKSQQDIVEEIMRSDFENIVKYLKTTLRIKEDIGEDSAEEFTSIIELPNQTRPVKQQSDPDDVDSSEDPFGDATDDSSDSSKKSSPEINKLLSRFATFIKRTGVLNENIGQVFTMLGGKDSKKFGKSLGKSFKKEELDSLRDYFSTPDSVKSFLEMHFEKDEVYQFNKLSDKEKATELLRKGFENAMKAKEDEVPEPDALNKGEDDDVFPSIDSSSDREDQDEKDIYKGEINAGKDFIKKVKSGKIGEIISPIRDSLLQKNKEADTKLYDQKVLGLLSKVIFILMNSMESEGMLQEATESFGKFYANKFRNNLIKKIPRWKLTAPEREWIMKNLDDKELKSLVLMVRKHYEELKGKFEPLGSKLDIEEALRPIIEKMLNEHYNH